LWPIFSLVFRPNLMIVLFCILIAVVSALVGRFLFLHRGEECYRLFVVVCRISVCSMVSQYISLIIGFVIGLFFSDTLGSEWPLLDPIQIAANNIFILVIIFLSILLAYISSYYWLLRKIILNNKVRRLFCLFCSIISGGTLLPLYLLLRVYVA